MIVGDAMPWKIILIVLAIVFFIMAGAGVPKYRWEWFGAACLTIAFALL